LQTILSASFAGVSSHFAAREFNEKKGGSREEHLLPLSSSSLFERLALLLPFFACGCQLHIKCGRSQHFVEAAQTRARARVCVLFIALARSLKHIKERRKALYWCKYQFANNIVCGKVQY
jgi:hypothetical protein